MTSLHPMFYDSSLPVFFYLSNIDKKRQFEKTHALHHVCTF